MSQPSLLVLVLEHIQVELMPLDPHPMNGIVRPNHSNRPGHWGVSTPALTRNSELKVG